MKKLFRLSEKITGLTSAATRYPATTVFLLLAAATNAYALIADKTYDKVFMACIVGAALSAVSQASYERFFQNSLIRLLLGLTSAALAGGYYLLVRSRPDYNTENNIRTSVLIFALIFAYMLAPVIKSRISFNESFMAAFKALFQSILYAAVIFIGCSLIIAAFDTLIAPIGSDTYLHMANLVFVLFAPVFFLSLIPVYPGRFSLSSSATPAAFAREENIARAASCPKFLEILISYIIIPLAEIFTVILVLYISLNISGDFWRNNLLEPLLISYAIVVMLILFLSARLENHMALWFRKIFPKVLVPIVVFQLFASTFIMRDTGVTHPRYFVILFGVFAACAGIILSLFPIKKTGIVAALLIAFSFVSIMPPVDAFTISRLSQRQRLETVLSQNGMLQNNALLPNANIPEGDKEKITSSMEYLYQINAAKTLTWLPSSFDYYADFESTFGFNRYGISGKPNRYINVFLSPKVPIDITGYQLLARASVSADGVGRETISTFQRNDQGYTLAKTLRDDQSHIILTKATSEELIAFNTAEVFSRYKEFDENKSALSTEQATFTVENDRAKLTLVVQNATINNDSSYHHAEFYIMVGLK
ncbi:hypothetical protein ACS3UN_00455 [Oscillospiraceae bacterium LTW-04]|nr:DUF4153 domain-containing protein [Oscillospiraceae bacterium MB24-C1]